MTHGDQEPAAARRPGNLGRWPPWRSGRLVSGSHPPLLMCSVMPPPPRPAELSASHHLYEHAAHDGSLLKPNGPRRPENSGKLREDFSQSAFGCVCLYPSGRSPSRGPVAIGSAQHVLHVRVVLADCHMGQNESSISLSRRTRSFCALIQVGRNEHVGSGVSPFPRRGARLLCAPRAHAHPSRRRALCVHLTRGERSTGQRVLDADCAR